ncbi:DUF1996 domain-containing protein [Streptomyces winkii]|uniref:DUF1996 domain-containing protein n=1 Tax=Streptomyces winkii TaxID=3051178 RepID=UPI0028D2C2F3|nr:DUF1996 domain-containing protein [Streptomyces sp. DSM 40971]
MRAHKRSRAQRHGIVAVVALLVGGGGIVVVGSSADAGESGASEPGASRTAQTVDCPSVQDRLQGVPAKAKDEVDRELAQLKTQIAEANSRLASARGEGGPEFPRNAVLEPLKDKRTATLERISIAIGRVADRPEGLGALAPCALAAGGDGSAGGSGEAGQEHGHGGGAGGDAGDGGPVRSDFVDITKVPGNVEEPSRGADASTGTFTSACGTNSGGQHNSDNVIVAPGVGNGAHHTHDYVGNKQVDADSTDESLAAQGTTCTNGDQSTYYWPVLRDRTKQGPDADKPGGGAEGNLGAVIEPASVDITFRGNAQSDVVAMPRFLRIITGDAKASTNGGANANASWSCTGFEEKVQLKDKYPICPEGSKVVRTSFFQSCWDGRNADSADHRSHVAFTKADGSCPGGFKAVPQLTERLTYDVPEAPDFAVDTFPEQKHKPVTDHGDFINVMKDDLMKEAVDCINSGRRCG